MKKLVWLLAAVILMVSTHITGALADAAAYDVSPADYYVYVATPDGGLNMRYGPGTEYSKVMQERIPDGVRLYIGLVSGNWGYTSYNGNEGWVALRQTTTTPPQVQTAPQPPTQTIPQTEPQTEVTTQVPPAQTEVQTEAESKPDTQTAPETNEQTAESDSQTEDDAQTASKTQDIHEDEQNVKKVIGMQMLIVALLILLIIAIAILAIIIINSKSKK